MKELDPRRKGAPQKPRRPQLGTAQPGTAQPGTAQPGTGRASPWQQGSAVRPDRIPIEDAKLRAAVSGPFQGLPAALVERRLIRRAEALWDELRAERPMPPATALASFSGPGFADHALLFAPDDDAGEEQMRLLRTGPALEALFGSQQEAGAPHALLLGRLAGLAAAAAAEARPVGLELGPGQWPNAPSRAELLLRAIALPFDRKPMAAPGGTDVRAAALVVVSWRQLLSPEETDALRRELAKALEHLHLTGC